MGCVPLETVHFYGAEWIDNHWWHFLWSWGCAEYRQFTTIQVGLAVWSGTGHRIRQFCLGPSKRLSWRGIFFLQDCVWEDRVSDSTSGACWLSVWLILMVNNPAQVGETYELLQGFALGCWHVKFGPLQVQAPCRPSYSAVLVLLLIEAINHWTSIFVWFQSSLRCL